MPGGGRKFGLKVEGVRTKDAQKIVDALASGKLVIAIMAKGHFTTSGHFIVLRGVTADWKILVADPYSTKNSNKGWNLSIILNEVNSKSGSGGPFWICS